MKAVITGATGMIGSTLINILLKKNIEVIAIIRPNSKKIKNIPKSDKIKIVECDLSNLNSLSTKLPSCNYFFHFGWISPAGINRNNPELQLKNVQYVLDAVKLAKAIGCESFIGAGSQAEYGLKNEILSKDTSINPVNSYGIAKYTAGKLSRILANDLNIKHVWARVLSVYGPKDNNYTLIMSCIDSILNNKSFDTTKGEQMWDYIYSEDCAKAFYNLAVNGKNGEVYTIGSGKVRPLKKYILTIKNNINPDFNLGIGNLDYSPNQVMYLCADISNLQKDTGFVPEISFEDGIKKTIKWYKKEML
ncbi:MAG: NAD(P)-dependent oxidoreductase [Methanobacteriaceae archaeon]|nr:NAD(P)-dependent oxidoreductase [Methanobacteriaceae archaeon]